MPSKREWEERAVKRITERLGQDGPPEARVVYCQGREDWDIALLRETGQHQLHILGRAADLMFYFDRQEGLLGWRDDGRLGLERQAVIDREAFRQAVVAELDLPKTARLGELKPVVLPPLGWTHQAVLFLAPIPSPDQVLRLWADPKTLKVIQCLKNAASPTLPGKPLPLEEAALGEARRLLHRRLEVAAIKTRNPQWYFEVQPGERQEYEGGIQLRVHTWRYWSAASVTFDRNTGEVLADVIEGLAKPKSAVTLDEQQALPVAAGLVEIPEEAKLEEFQHYLFRSEQQLARLRWSRVHEELPVEGDFLEISVHPLTHKLVRFDRKWRPLELRPGKATMTAQEAVTMVREQQQQLGIEPGMQVGAVRKAIVEYTKDRLQPGPIEDRVAWIVTLVSSLGAAHVHVDAVERTVLGVRRGG